MGKAFREDAAHGVLAPAIAELFGIGMTCCNLNMSVVLLKDAMSDTRF